MFICFISMCVTEKSYIMHKLHIGSWNINGYKHKGFNKCSDPRFLREVNNKDIICLSETYCSLDEAMSLPGFKSVHLVRPKAKRTNKIAGGLSIFIRNELKAGIKFLIHKTNYYIWLKLDKEFFGTSKIYSYALFTILLCLHLIPSH